MRVLAAILCAATLAAQSSGTISGVVRDSVTHQVLADVQVTLTGGGTSTGAQTDMHGAFRFDSLAPGKYSLRVEKPGYHGKEPRDVELGADSLNLDLSPDGQLDGRVMDVEGRPVAGVTVETISAFGSVFPWEGNSPTATDGKFLIQNLREGDYRVRVRIPEARRAAGYPAWEYYPGVADLEQASPIHLAEGQQMTGLTIRLRRVPMVTVRGRVIDLGKDDSARPKEVAIDCEPGPINQSFARRDVDADGRFHFEDIPQGRHELLVYRGTGSDDLPYRATIVAGEEEVKVTLPPFTTVTGVVKSTVMPWEGVLGISVSADGVWRRNVVPDENGAFTLPGVPPGDWHLRVESNNLHAGERRLRLASVKSGEVNLLRGRLTVTEGGTPPVLIALSDEAGHITGTLEDATSKEEMLVVAEPADGSPLGHEHYAHPGADGSFRFSNLLPGEYLVSAWGLQTLQRVGYPGGCPSHAVPVTVVNAQTAVVRVKRCN